MKKTVFIFLVVFAILTVTKAQKIVKVGAFNYYPAIFMDTDGAVKGFYVDALNELGEKENLKFIYVFGTWNEGLERIKTGEVDILTSVAITEELLKYMDYTTTPILTVWSEVYVKPKSEIKGILDLNGKTVAVMKSDFNGIYIKQLTEKLSINCNFIETTDFEEVFKLINAGNVDAGVVSNIFGAPKSIEYQLISSGIVFNPFDIYFTVKKDSNQDLLKLLNTTLHNWKHDRNSVLNSARQKWSHANVGAIEVFPTWLQKAVYTTLFMVLALVALIAFLRYKIGVATKSIKESEERFILAMKASNDGLFDWNIETNDIYYSPGWKKMLGYEDYELPNDFSVWENFTDPEDVKKTMELIEKLKSKQIDRFVIEFKTRHKKGHWVDILARGEAFFNKQGKAIRIVGTHVDITERKKAEQELAQFNSELKQKNDLLERTGKMAKVGGWELDLETSLVTYSKQAALIHEFDLPYEPPNLSRANEFYPPEAWPIIQAAVQAAIEHGTAYDLESPFITAKGRRIWVRVQGIAVKENNKTIKLRSTIQDITEQKKLNLELQKAKEKAEENEKKYNIIAEYTYDWETYYDNQTNIIFINSAFEKITGYSRDAFRLKKIQFKDFVHKDDLPEFESTFNDIFTGKTIDSYCFRIIHKNSEIVFVEMCSQAVFSPINELLGIRTSIRDISERKLTEQELIKAKEEAEISKEKYKNLATDLNKAQSLTKVGSWKWYFDENRLEWSDEMYRIFGIEKDKFTGILTDVIQQSIHPDDRAMVEASNNSVVEKGAPIPLEYRIVMPNGTIKTVWAEAGEIIMDNASNPSVLTGIVQDITERKLAEEAIKESENKYRQLFDLSPVGTLVVGMDKRFIKCNAAFCNFIGYTENELIGKHISEITYPEDIDMGMNEIKQIANGSTEAATVEKRYLRKDGQIVWGNVAISIVKDANHNPLFLIPIIQDITLRKQAEIELMAAKEKAEESDERLRNLVDSTDAIIWEADAQTFKFTFVSKQAERLLGYPVDAWYADGFWADHLFEDDKEAAINNCVYSPKQKLNRDFECRFVSKDGRIVWLRDVVNVVIKDQEPYVLRGVMFDITAIKLAQEALKESEEKLSALFASMTEMVALHELVFDEYGQPVNYRITDCNTAFTQVTGIKKEDAIGKLATELYGTKTPPYFEEYKQVAISQVPHTYNTYFAPMDKHFSISVVSPKKNQFATITTDITALQQIQNIISAKNKELENYLYVSSHDLRSPLVNIQGFSQRLQKQINSINSLVQECYLKPEVKTNLTQITDEAIPETLNFIFTSVAKMDILINSLLQISRVGRVKMEIKNIDTNLLITNIIKQLNFQLSEISATVKVGKLPNCYGDENTLNQLFSNLLDNAIKYRNPNISLLVNIEGKVIYNKVIYSIKDNGIGIAAKYLNKIWDVFYRIDPSINENGEGIGLSIVKRIIDKHKGKIWVESEEGMGTTFYIELLIKEFEE